MPRNNRSILSMAALAAGALVALGSAASAQGDLYYLHNASAYYAWSDYDTCKAELSVEQCTPTLDQSVCGRYLTSTLATRNVALDKLKRNETIIFRHTNGDSEYCRIQP